MASVPRIESPGHRLESLGTPHLKLSDAEEENLEEAARRKPWMGSRVGGGSDVRVLYKPQDYGIKPRGRMGQATGAKGFEAFAGWPAQLRQEMKGINALSLEITRKSYQRKQQSLARVDELKAENPGRRSKDSKLEPLQVSSDSGSVASSDAALSFLQIACPCDSSESEPLESDVPTCHSLTLESDDGDESVGSSSLAEPATGRRAGAAQDQFACLTESNHAVPSFLTEDPTDSDNDSSDEVPCDANLPKTDDPTKLQEV